MYTTIPNLVLVNSSHFAVGVDTHLEPLRPQICTFAENPLGHRFYVALLERYGGRSIGHSLTGERTYIGKGKGITCRFRTHGTAHGSDAHTDHLIRSAPIHVAQVGCLRVKVVDAPYPIE